VWNNEGPGTNISPGLGDYQQKEFTLVRWNGKLRMGSHSTTVVVWYIAGPLDQSLQGKYCPKISSMGLEG